MGISREDAIVKILKLEAVLKHGKNVKPTLRVAFEKELKRLQSLLTVAA